MNALDTAKLILNERAAATRLERERCVAIVDDVLSKMKEWHDKEFVEEIKQRIEVAK